MSAVTKSRAPPISSTAAVSPVSKGRPGATGGCKSPVGAWCESSCVSRGKDSEVAFLFGFTSRRDDGGLGAQFRCPRFVRMDQEAWNGLEPRELGGRQSLLSREHIEARTTAPLRHQQGLQNTNLADGRGKFGEVSPVLVAAVTASISSIEICRTVWSGVSPINCST